MARLDAAKLPLPKPTASTEQLTSSFTWESASFRCCFSLPIVRISPSDKSVNMNLGAGFPIPKGASFSNCSMLAIGTSDKLHTASAFRSGMKSCSVSVAAASSFNRMSECLQMAAIQTHTCRRLMPAVVVKQISSQAVNALCKSKPAIERAEPLAMPCLWINA